MISISCPLTSDSPPIRSFFECRSGRNARCLYSRSSLRNLSSALAPRRILSFSASCWASLVAAAAAAAFALSSWTCWEVRHFCFWSSIIWPGWILAFCRGKLGQMEVPSWSKIPWPLPAEVVPLEALLPLGIPLAPLLPRVLMGSRCNNNKLTKTPIAKWGARLQTVRNQGERNFSKLNLPCDETSAVGIFTFK